MERRNIFSYNVAFLLVLDIHEGISVSYESIIIQQYYQ